jgi:hypothetical protein
MVVGARRLPPLGWGVLWRLAVSPLPALVWSVGYWKSQASYENGVVGVVTGVFDTIAIASSFIILVTLVFGVPLYALYRWRGWTAFWQFAIGGALIPTLLFQILPELLFRGSRLSSYEAGCQAIIDGTRTACGYGILAEGIASDAILGAISALVFWALLRLIMRREHPSDAGENSL